jgi:hypothetical protein
VVEPPQSIAEFSSKRARRIGAFYSRLIHLMMTQPPDLEHLDVRTKWKALVKFVQYIGPAFVDKSYRKVGANGQEIYLPMDLEIETTWEKIFGICPTNPMAMVQRLSMATIGDPERDSKAFKGRLNRMVEEFGIEGFETRRRNRRAAKNSGSRTPKGPSPLTREDLRNHTQGTPSKPPRLPPVLDGSTAGLLSAEEKVAAEEAAEEKAAEEEAAEEKAAEEKAAASKAAAGKKTPTRKGAAGKKKHRDDKSDLGEDKPAGKKARPSV